MTRTHNHNRTFMCEFCLKSNVDSCGVQSIAAFREDDYGNRHYLRFCCQLCLNMYKFREHGDPSMNATMFSTYMKECYKHLLPKREANEADEKADEQNSKQHKITA